MKALYIIEETYAYPKPSHAKRALVVFVTTRPYLSIIGKVPQVAIDIKRERNALIILMLAMRYHENKIYQRARSCRLSTSGMHQVNEISNSWTEYSIDLVSSKSIQKVI